MGGGGEAEGGGGKRTLTGDSEPPSSRSRVFHGLNYDYMYIST